MSLQVITADCLDAMAAMEPASVDLVFGSPPYEAQRTYSIGFSLKGQDWVDWMVDVFRASLRVSRGLVAMVLEGPTKNYRWSATPALLMADLHRAGIHLRKPPAFHRVGVPGSGGPDWLRNDYEFIVCATNGGKLPWSDNTAMGHPPKWAPGGEMSYRLSDGTRRNQWGGSSKSTGGERLPDGTLRQADQKPSHRIGAPGRKRFGYDGEKRVKGAHDRHICAIANPGNVIRCEVGGGIMGDRLCHENEAPFPEKLAEFFILSFCPPGGTVLDPFIGSGTTAKMAIQHGRNAIAIDVRESQTDLTKKRTSLVQRELRA